jgi:hypothetical protein
MVCPAGQEQGKGLYMDLLQWFPARINPGVAFNPDFALKKSKNLIR